MVVVFCLWELPERRSCQVNVLQNALDAWQSVPLCYCSEKEAVFVVVLGGGHLSAFVWVIGLCLAVSGLEVLTGIDIWEIVILYTMKSAWHRSALCSRVGHGEVEAKIDPDTSQLYGYGPRTLLSGAGPPLDN